MPTARIPTAIGECHLSWDTAGLTGFAFPAAPRLSALRPLSSAVRSPSSALRPPSSALSRPSSVVRPPAIAAVLARVQRHLAGDLQDFAARITAAGGICLAAASDSETGRTSVLFAAAANPPLPMSELLKQTLTPIGGKGGDNAMSAQGGVQGGDAERILATAREILESKYE